MPDILAIPDHLQMLRSMAIWMPMSVPWAVETAREIESFRPTVVLTDLITPGSAIAAEAAGLHCVLPLTTVHVHRLFPGLAVPGKRAASAKTETAAPVEFQC